MLFDSTEQLVRKFLNDQPFVKNKLISLINFYKEIYSRRYREAIKKRGYDTIVDEIEKAVYSRSEIYKSQYLANVSLKLKGEMLIELKRDLAKRAIEYAITEKALYAHFDAEQLSHNVDNAFGAYRLCEEVCEDNSVFKNLYRKIFNSPVAHLALRKKVLRLGESGVKLNLTQDRVCYILHNSLPYSSGGYATRAQGVAEGFKKTGRQVVCITRPGYPLDIKANIKDCEVSYSNYINGIEYRRILEPSKSNTKSMEYMLGASEKLKEIFIEIKPAFVLAASNYMCALPALIAARELNIPFVYEVRGFWEISRASREPSYRNTLRYKIQAAMEAFVADSSDLVFTLTKEMKKELINRGVGQDKIHLLPNCCEPERFFPKEETNDLKQHYEIPDKVLVIGYIGTFVQYEGLDDLAQACGILNDRGVDFRLLLVGSENTSGSGQGPIYNSIANVAKEKGFIDKLIAPGRVPHEEVEKYYSIIDIAPFPRKPLPVCEMVSPMKPLEAMASGKAVIVSSVGALTEMVSDGETGLIFEKGNVRDLADTLERIIRDTALRKKIGENGRAWVCEERTWTKVVGEAANLIDQRILRLGLTSNVAKY